MRIVPAVVSKGAGTHASADAKAAGFLMNKERNLVPVPPSIGYYDGIQEGFKQNGLPEQSLGEALKKVWREQEAVRQKQQKER